MVGESAATKSGSVFNMAMAYLARIDKLLTQCSFYAFNLDMYSWQRCLRCIYREVSIKLAPEEIKDIDGDNTKVINVNDSVNYINSNFINLNSLMNNKMTLITKRKEIFLMLDNIEQKLRKKMQDKDMLLPGKSDPRFAILER